jgi:pyruvate formate lyase activating enzyme
VRRNARAAAFEDPRFAPLEAHEWAGLEVEVSLIVPPEPLPAADENEALRILRPGDGLVLGYGKQQATFLPQVWEQLPDPRDFLAALKLKAGPRPRLLERRRRARAVLRAQVRRGADMTAHVDETLDDAWPARWWHALPDGRIQCDLCPRDCRLHDGQRGLCFVRARRGDAMVLTTYGRSSGFCIDPIEKKPLNHFLPGSSVLSFGTAGCNLACRFCQNWDISKSREMDRLTDRASPEGIAAAARGAGCSSVAFTYNDPVIFAEYAMDTADACHAFGLAAVAVTAGYIGPQARREFYAKMDAANIDLKGFTEDFYFRQTGAHLAPVLDTLQYVWHETRAGRDHHAADPGLNDGDAEIDAETRWLVEHLGPTVPLHFTAFHPDYKLDDLPPTPRSTLQRAREIALANGSCTSTRATSTTAPAAPRIAPAAGAC